jgi:type IV secretory pathway VirJ component
MTLKHMYRRASLGLVALLMAAAAPMVQAQTADAVIPVRVSQTMRPLVIFWSGDGGWHGDLDEALGQTFIEQGFDVVALDTNKWFASPRTQAQASQMLAQILHTYGQPRGRRIVLMGWSYGADVLPLAYNRLAPADKASIQSIILLAGSKTVQLQVTIPERMGLIAGDTPVVPELQLIPSGKLLCVYNQEDRADSGCLASSLPPTSILGLPGDHAFDHDANALAARLLPYAK